MSFYECSSQTISGILVKRDLTKWDRFSTSCELYFQYKNSLSDLSVYYLFFNKLLIVSISYFPKQTLENLFWLHFLIDQNEMINFNHIWRRNREEQICFLIIM